MCPKSGIYSEDFKWKVVQQVLSGTLTKEEARRVYCIGGKCTILYWMRAFSGVTDYRNGGGVSEDLLEMAKTTKLKEAHKQIAQLQAELKRERMRADLWQKVVEVAEEELHIDIRKKFGAKQSPGQGNNQGRP